jgi:hypothetical protein
MNLNTIIAIFVRTLLPDVIIYFHVADIRPDIICRPTPCRTMRILMQRFHTIVLIILVTVIYIIVIILIIVICSILMLLIII